MPATTRDLPVTTIFVVTLVAVALLGAIVLVSEAGFYYFQNRQTDAQYARGANKTYETTGLRIDNTDLAKLKVEQSAILHETRGGKLPIEDAMKQVAEQY